MAQVTAPKGRRPAATAPILAETRYDLVSAGMLAALVVIMLITVWITAMWYFSLPPATNNEIPVEFVQFGGFEDGKPNETQKVESPEDPTDDPSVVETDSEQAELEEATENIIEFSEQAAQQVPQQTATALENSGKVGSREGTGGRPLGSGGGEGNSSQRWFIRIGDEGTTESYAAQLDFFKIKLGLLTRSPARIHELSNLSAATATRVDHNTGKALKKQAYFTWAGGTRKKTDIALLKKHGLTVGNGTIFHFYPQAVIQQLTRLEKAHAREAKRSVKDVVRTYFRVRSRGGAHEFYVTKISFK